MRRRRRKMSEVGCSREGKFSPFNSEEITVSSEGDAPFSLQDDEGPHQSITRRKTFRLFILQALWGVNKDPEGRKKGLFLDLLKSVTVLQSSGIWKTVIHHCLSSLDTWLWPWAINSITDVLQQDWIITQEKRGPFAHSLARSWMAINMDREVWFEQNVLYAEWKAPCGCWFWLSWNTSSGGLHAELSLWTPHLCLMNMYGCKCDM